MARFLGLAGIVAVLLLAGCGGSSHKTASATTGAAAGPSAAPAGPSGTSALPPGAPPALRGVFGHVLRASELPGFSPAGRQLGINASSWVAGLGLPPSERASEAARLQRLGFVAAVGEHLASSSGSAAEALSIVEQFPTQQAAARELAAQVKMGEAQGAKAFAVPGIPGASGFGGAHGPFTGVNVVFQAGPYYYLVGAGWPSGTPNPPTRAAVIAAAERQYRRLNG